MSKSNFKRFKKNDYSHDEEDYDYRKPMSDVNKRENKRFERALKTKDITSFIDEDYEDYEDIYSSNEYRKY
jgi:hypothetical protein